MALSGMPLLQRVAERIIAGYLRSTGRVDVVQTEGRASYGGKGVDITYAWEGSTRRIKVKPDPYFGTEGAKVGNRDLVFYRSDASAYAIEAVANAATREPGWMFDSPADDLYYYFLAINQPEDEIRALLSEPDEVFFSELAVDRDELVIMPMRGTREWFEAHYQDYTPRPVLLGGASAWYRLVPRADLDGKVPGSTRPGAVFRSIVL